MQTDFQQKGPDVGNLSDATQLFNDFSSLLFTKNNKDLSNATSKVYISCILIISCLIGEVLLITVQDGVHHSISPAGWLQTHQMES